MNKRLITILLLLLAIPAATIISADEYVVNGNFEDGDKGWLMVPGSVVEDNVGFNGTGGLKVFRLSNDEPYLVNHQYVDVEPGTPYRLSAMVKAEGIGPGETSIGLEYTDENGKWIGGDYIAGPKGTSEWREVTTSCQVPLNAAKSSVVVYIRKGSTGTAYFDVVSLRNFDEPPRLQMVYPVQGVVRRGGCPIRFQAGLLGNTKGLEAFAGMRVRTTVKDALGEVVFSGEKALDGSSAEFMLPELEDDEVVISGELLDAEGNFLANSAETRCKVVDEATAAPKGACYIDEYGRTIVDGEPFLPIGLYMSSIEDEEEIEMIFDSDYNCLMPYNIHKTGFETLDKLDAHGVKVIFSLKDLYEIPRTRTTFESIRKQLGMEGAAPEDIVTHFVTKFREHPSILAWYNNDEIPLAHIEIPAARRQLINSLDPHHPVWGVLCVFMEAPFYGSTCDILGLDPYPIRDQAVSHQKVTVEAMDAADKSGQPFWAVPQLFSWAVYQSKTFPETYGNWIEPRPDQMRGITLLEALRGARGFIGYSFFDLKRPMDAKTYGEPKGTYEEFLWHWNERKEIATMLKNISPWLLSKKGPERVQLELKSGDAQAAFFTRDDAEGKSLVIVASVGPENVDATLTLPADFPPMKSAYGHAKEVSPGVWHFSGNDIWGEILSPRD